MLPACLPACLLARVCKNFWPNRVCLFHLVMCLSDYLSPAYLDDMVEVQTNINSIRNASLVFAQKILSLEKNTVLFKAEVKVVSVSTNNLKPCAIPQEIMEKLNGRK